jgi:polysaccharide deacetylase family protein (PEP-CTERM system associated)
MGLGLFDQTHAKAADSSRQDAMLNALTIDVEDYFQVSGFEAVVGYETWDRYESRVERNTHRILDILGEYETKATFFVLGWLADRYPKLVMEIDQRGHEVACHGYSHRLIYNQTKSEFREETRRAKCGLEKIIGKPVLGYRAASYSITAKSLWALDILAEEGFLYDSSIFPVWHDRYGIPGSKRFPYRLTLSDQRTMAEFPLTTVHLGPVDLPIAGGGYLRLLPVWFVRWAIQRIQEQEQAPVSIYLHPWELDPEQPRVNGSRLSRFRHYLNLHAMEGKLRALLSTFRFGSMQEVLVGQGLLPEPVR